MRRRAANASNHVKRPDERVPTWAARDPEETFADSGTRTDEQPAFTATPDETQVISPSSGDTLAFARDELDELETLDADAIEDADTFHDRPSEPRVRSNAQSGFYFAPEESSLRLNGRWEELIELYLEKLTSTRTPDVKAGIFRSIAEVFDLHLSDPSQAVDALVEAIALDPSDSEAVDAMEAIARRDGSWSALCLSVEEALRDVQRNVPTNATAWSIPEADRHREVKFCELLVRWHTRERGTPELAERYKDRIRQLDSRHPLVQRELAHRYADQGAYALAENALRTALKGVRPGERVPIYVALGALYENHLDDRVEAQKAYEAALELAPASFDALLGLERILRENQKYRELERVLERQAHASEASFDDRMQALLRLAELNEKHFLRYDTAAASLRAVLAADPTHEEALAALTRTQLAMRDWHGLASTLETRARLASDPRDRIDVYLRLAELHEAKIGDVDAAIDTYERILRLDGAATSALSELARLSEKKGDYRAAAGYRGKLASRASDPTTAAQIFVQIGDMLSVPGRDEAGARQYYERALSIAPRHLGAWEALQKDAERAGDIERIAHCIEQRASSTESPRLRAQLLLDLARLKQEVGSQRGAFLVYEEVLAVDPRNEIAAAFVLPEYTNAARWEEAAPLCDLLLNAATRDGDLARAAALHRTAAMIATKTQNSERALSAALAAYELAPQALDVRTDLLAVAHAIRHDRSAIERTRPAIARITTNCRDLEVAAVVHLAEIERALGDDEHALETLALALEKQPESLLALSALSGLHASLGDFENAAAFKTKVADATVDPEARHALLIEAAEIWRTRAQNLPMAVIAFERALAIQPNDSRLLHVLLGAYGELECWEKLAETLRRITEMDRDPVKKAKGIFTMAQVVERKIGDRRRAAALFQEVIAVDSSRLDAFERAVRIYTEEKDWNLLDKAYRRMIDRTPDTNVELRHALFHQLGLIYRDRLRDPASAIEAFRAAGKLKPSEQNGKILTELHILAGRLDEGISDARAAIDADPGNAGTYANLYDLCVRAGAFDDAWCAVNVLAHLGQLSQEQKKFFDAHPPIALSHVPGTMPESAWASHILHPELDPTLTTVFRVMALAVTRVKIPQVPEAHRAYALGEPVRPDHSYNAEALLDTVRNASDILHVAPPPIFARRGSPAPLQVAHGPMPALVTSIDALDTLSYGALTFLAGKRLAELRPELLGRAIFPTVTEMTTALATAVRIVRGVRAPEPGLQQLDRELVTMMTAPERAALAEAVGRATASGAKVDVKRWSQLVDASSSRAGLLLCGHVDEARRAMVQDGQNACDLPLRARIEHLCNFAVSNELRELRAAIGVAVTGR